MPRSRKSSSTLPEIQPIVPRRFQEKATSEIETDSQRRLAITPLLVSRKSRRESEIRIDRVCCWGFRTMVLPPFLVSLFISPSAAQRRFLRPTGPDCLRQPPREPPLLAPPSIQHRLLVTRCTGVFPVCSTGNPSPTCVFSTLFQMFPVFLVAEYMAIRRALRLYASWPEIQNTDNTKSSLGQTGNILATRLGTLATSSCQPTFR